MIRVEIEYREAAFKDDHFIEVRDVTEAIVGSVFEEEQSAIDVCVSDFGRFDAREDDLFIVIEIAEEDIHHDLKILTEQFTTQIGQFLKEYFSHEVPFRVWVQRIAGEFAEVWTTKKER